MHSQLNVHVSLCCVCCFQSHARRGNESQDMLFVYVTQDMLSINRAMGSDFKITLVTNDPISSNLFYPTLRSEWDTN